MRNLLRHLALIFAGTLAMLILTAPSAWANGCNLYATSDECVFNGGIFDVVGPQPTGTGVIDSFLRVQQKGTEQGFNTNTRPVNCDAAVCDDKTDPNFTRSILTSDVPIVTIGTSNYREFFLDINEQAAGDKSYLTLDQLEIYVSNSGTLDTHSSAGGGSLTGGTNVYDMETGNHDNWVNLNYLLIGGGSGSGDMRLYVLDTGQFNQTYTYLYSQFGCVSCGNGANTKYASGAGFEEWWVLGSNGGSNNSSAVPEPGTCLLLGSGIAALLAKRRRRREAGLPQSV